MEGNTGTSDKKNQWVSELFISAGSYTLALSSYLLLKNTPPFDTYLGTTALLAFVLFVVPGIAILLWRRSSAWNVSFLAAFLGTCSAVGVHVATAKSGTPLFYLGFYIMALSFFHQSEYITTALFNPHRLSLDSYMLNHSTAYHIAAVASWTEYAMEYWLTPSLKTYVWVARVGLLLVVFGELLRKMSMFTARSNFSHLISFRKRSDHELVTHGVYSCFRHPSYVGWFYWSIGTQLLLCNPVCVLAYTAASWMFFDERIEEEEITLLSFFGQQYEDYQRRVGTGLPLIRGHSVAKQD